MDKIQYISPSLYYYWEKCPLQAVFSKQRIRFFPNSPNEDLGSLIHKFYEKQNTWKIDSVEKFNEKWKESIDEINRKFQEDELKSRFYPIQWHSKYYSIKKHLLCKNLISRGKKYKFERKSIVKYSYEEWVNNDYIGGEIDLQIKENDLVKQIIDFKTGTIYEKYGNKLEIKELYRQQLALYCSVILEKQDIIPDLFLETIDGKRVKIDIGLDYIDALTNKVKLLKENINRAIESNTINRLANPNLENCGSCNYRPHCQKYKSTLFNKKNGSRIDIQGEITEVSSKEAKIRTKDGEFIVKRIKQIDKYIKNLKCEIYNLYLPESDGRNLYETLNTIISYAG
jgi:hypothetical protein